MSPTGRARLTDPFGRVRTVPRATGRRLFGADPARYDRVRPEYPARIFEILERRCGLGLGTIAFEVGPGTGKATRPLLERGVARLTLIEPDPRMVRYLRRRLVPDRARVRYVAAPFESARLPPASFDLGVAATSFHWVGERRALRKVARLLRPGGWWAAWWSLTGDPFRPTPYTRTAQPIYDRASRAARTEGRGTDAYRRGVRDRVRMLRSVGAFDRIATQTVRWTRTLDTESLIDLHRTFGDIVLLPSAVRRRFFSELRALVRRRFGGRVTLPMIATVYTARRRRGRSTRSVARARAGGRGRRPRASRASRSSR